MEKTLPKILQSSADPKILSRTVKGIGIAVIPTIIFVAKFFELDVAETDLAGLVNIVASILSGVVIFLGIVRKIVIRLDK